VHAALESKYGTSPEWIKTQADEGSFITDYAARNPAKEDLPESAIFAYTMLKHPGRLSADIEEWVHKYLPKHLAFFSTIFSLEIPITK